MMNYLKPYANIERERERERDRKKRGEDFAAFGT